MEASAPEGSTILIQTPGITEALETKSGVFRIHTLQPVFKDKNQLWFSHKQSCCLIVA